MIKTLSEKTKKRLVKYGIKSFKGKTVLITGANSGIGFKAAEISAYLGAKVILACRNAEKAEAAKDAILRDNPNSEVSVEALDVASFKSIDAFVKRLEEKKTDIDVFVNNAGVFRKPGQKTEDGFELILGTNYVGTYYLTKTILPYLSSLKHKVIYINTVSIAAKFGKIDYSDFYGEKKYGNVKIYARSKLALARYTYYLARKNENKNVLILMTHPGIALTPLGLNAFGRWIDPLAKALGWIFNSPEKSAMSLPYVMSRDIPAGSIVGPSKCFGGWGYPKINRVPDKIKTGGEKLAVFTEKEIEKYY